MLLGGVLFAEYKRGKGWRWVRHRSTWSKSDNLAKTDLNVNEIVKHIAYEIRTFIEERYTGEKADETIIASIRSDLTAQLTLFRDEGLITNSRDPITGAVRPSFVIDRVTISGDILNVSFSIIPVPSINYELITENVQLAVLSA
jgi:hypothetical protein